MKKQILTLSFFVLVTACSSTKELKGTEKVLSRIDDLSSRPDWFKESQDIEDKGDKVIFWGRSTLKRGERIETGYKISELSAKSKIANYVSERINSITQGAEEVSDQDRGIFREVITQKSKVRLSEVKNGKRYWEKVLIHSRDEDGEVEFRVFQSVEIKKSDLAKLVKESLEGTKGLSDEFKQKVDAEWDKVAQA